MSAAPRYELVLIDKRGIDRSRLAHLKKAVRPDPPRYPKGRITIEDLLEFQVWLQREDYAPKDQAWYDRFSGGSCVVGHDSVVQSLLAPDMSVVGISLNEIKRQMKD